MRKGRVKIVISVLVASVVMGLPAWAVTKTVLRPKRVEVPVAQVQPTPKPTLKPTAKPTPPSPRPRAATSPAQPTTPVAPPAPAAPAPVRSGPTADMTALLIGINNAPGSTPLEGSVTDVQTTKKALLKYGFKEANVQTLIEGQATRQGILNALDAFAARTSGKGLAVFHLSTHSSGGDATFASGGGGRISRHELAAKLGRVPGKLWSNLAMCYSGAYALPGVVGPNRIAVFSSSATDRSWQVGAAGSWMTMYMIDKGMLQRQASSIENAYGFAKAELKKDAPERTPILSDGIAGDVKLPV
jgi:hypothetical protein